MVRRSRPSHKYRWVQDCLSEALNDTIKRGDADILSSMGHQLIAMSAAGVGDGPSPADAHDALGQVLFERESAVGHRASRPAPLKAAEWTTVAHWLAEQNVAETLAKCLIETTSMPDGLSSLRQQFSTSDGLREALVARLQGGVDALADSLLPALAELVAPSALFGGSEGSAADATPDLPLAADRSSTGGESGLTRASADHPKLLVVGAINVDVTAHVRGALDATRASTVVGSDEPPSFTQGEGEGKGEDEGAAWLSILVRVRVRVSLGCEFW